jgi:quercetin dioxygenase-like cupin family protein
MTGDAMSILTRPPLPIAGTIDALEGTMTILAPHEPQTVHRGMDELPFVDIGGGAWLQVCQVDLTTGIWVVRNRFEPGSQIQKHQHTGHVYAFTKCGSWHYLESPEAVNTAGSYLYEPAGSVHTLNVPDTNTEVTEVSFIIYGANLNLAEDGSVDLVIDAHNIAPFYKTMCADQHGITDPPVVVIDLHSS